jgi:nitrogen fixation protein NifU and related proteins
MAGLEDLYREIILDHYRSPRNRGELPVPPAVTAEGHNPLCGDEITVYLDVDSGDGDGVVRDLKVSGQGCSISQSSASMMSQAVIGKTVPEVRAIVRRFKTMMSIDEENPGDEGGDGSSDGGGSDDGGDPHPLGDLEALQGVVKFPVRIKCATLAWNTLVQALDQEAPAPDG